MSKQNQHKGRYRESDKRNSDCDKKVLILLNKTFFFVKCIEQPVLKQKVKLKVVKD